MWSASGAKKNLRLWLCRVVPQGHTVPLDIVEALLTEVIPVGNKAIFGWTAGSAHTVAAQANRQTGGRMQQPRTEHGQLTDGRTHRQKYRLVTAEMDMIQLISIKLEKTWGEHGKKYNFNEWWQQMNKWNETMSTHHLIACWNMKTATPFHYNHSEDKRHAYWADEEYVVMQQKQNGW